MSLPAPHRVALAQDGVLGLDWLQPVLRGVPGAVAPPAPAPAPAPTCGVLQVVAAQVEFECRSRKQFITVEFQALSSRWFQLGFDRVNLHRPTRYAPSAPDSASIEPLLRRAAPAPAPPLRMSSGSSSNNSSPASASPSRITFSEGLTDIAFHVIGCHLSQDTRINNALDDVATNVAQPWQRLLATS